MELGVLVLMEQTDMEESIRKVAEYGFGYCQLCCWNMELYTEETAQSVLDACEKYRVKISTFWAGWSGPKVWNPYEGPDTLGIVPLPYREQRMKELKQGSDFAKRLGVDKVATHVGFIPETPAAESYRQLVEALKEIVGYCRENGQCFLFETGQETPATLLRTIEEIGLDNVGINLDPSNLITYGKGNPVDALYVFGQYVMDVHAKDGVYPTTGKKNGTQMPIGQGMVNFPALVRGLKERGYDGTLIIEREIRGEQQIKDILAAKEYLEKLI